MKYTFLLAFCCSILMGCSETPNQKSANNPPSDRSGKLVHTVFFKLKPDADKQAMVKSLESLRNIALIKKVEIGTFQDTGNPTSLSDYTLLVQMTFDNLADFKVYENDPIHLASRNDTKDLLAGPPIGYDYFIK